MRPHVPSLRHLTERRAPTVGENGMEGFSPLPKDLHFFYEWQEKDLPNVGRGSARTLRLFLKHERP